MAFRESLARLGTAGLQLRVAVTKVPYMGALVAENVEFRPRSTISKRPGYRRREELCMNQPLTAYVAFDSDGKELLVGQDVNEL